MSRIFRNFLFMLYCLIFFFPFLIRAQEYAPNEFTVSTNLQTMGVLVCEPISSGSFCNLQTNQTHFLSPPVFTYTRNISPSLGLVATVTPATQFLSTQTYESGRETLAMGGVRSGWRGRRFDLFGQVLTGVASFSCDLGRYIGGDDYTHCKRQSHFALEYGATAEYHLTRRY